MRTLLRTILLPVAVAASLVTAGAGGVSAAATPLGFAAAFSGTAAITSPTTTEFHGIGAASILGPITTVGHAQITGIDSSHCAGGVANSNVETLTALGGDQLVVTSQDVACPIGPNRYHGSGSWTVTGGTGRYTGATGRGSFEGVSDFNAGTFAITLLGSVTLAR